MSRLTLNIFNFLTTFRAVALATMLSLAFTQVSAQDLYKGVDAHTAGDYTTALQELRPLAEQGDAWAQYFLADMYQRGLGVPKDVTEVIKWLRLAAEQRHVESMIGLASIYAYDFGESPRYVKAHMWSTITHFNGDEIGKSLADEMESSMTDADIQKARAMAKECINSGYTKCGD